MTSPENLKKLEALTESLETLCASFTIYIMFIDLCESTAIKQFCLEGNMPDSIWITRQKVFLSRCATLIRQYGGQVIKTIGDEVMGSFSDETDPTRIVKCGIEVMQRFNGLKTYDKGMFKIRAKASLDTGLCYDGSIDDSGRLDPIGTCVDRCARLNKVAQKNEIIMSKQFKERLNPQENQFQGIKLTPEHEILPGLGDTEYFRIELGEA